MRFSLITTIIVFAFSVNAASLNKRTVSSGVQTCINDLVVVDSQCTVVTNGVNSYTATAGYIGALTVEAQISTLESKLTTAGTSCCATTSEVTSEDAGAIVGELEIFIPSMIAAIQAIINKKSAFVSIQIITPLIKGDVNTLYTKTMTIINCLIVQLPSEYYVEVQGSIDDLNTAFNNAIAAYA